MQEPSENPCSSAEQCLWNEVETSSSLSREVLNSFNLLFPVFWEHQDLGARVFWSKDLSASFKEQGTLWKCCTSSSGIVRGAGTGMWLLQRQKWGSIDSQAGCAPPCISFITRNQDCWGVYFWTGSWLPQAPPCKDGCLEDEEGTKSSPLLLYLLIYASGFITEGLLLNCHISIFHAGHPKVVTPFTQRTGAALTEIQLLLIPSVTAAHSCCGRSSIFSQSAPWKGNVNKCFQLEWSL